MRRRLLLIGGLATIGGAVLTLASPAIERARRSFRTSSSPGTGTYERAAGWFLGGWYKGIAWRSAAVLDGVDAPEILEIGPGPGHLAERLLARIRGARWTGLDVDPAMLAAARRRLDSAGHRDDAVTLIEGDVAAMPFEDDTFDLVVSSLSAHHWTEPEAGFREIRRVLRPGGRALLVDLPPTWGHAETGSAGLRAATSAFPDATWIPFRGIGHLTFAWLVDARKDD